MNEILDKKREEHMKPGIPDTSILKEWNDLRAVMWSGNGVVSPNKFVHNVHKIATIKNKEIFTGWTQNDMPEFLLFMIECIHNSISRSVSIKITGKTENKLDDVAVQCYTMLQNVYSKEYSEIMDLFFGIYMSEISSMTDGTVHAIKPENFFMLDLPVLDGNKLAFNLYDCLDIFTKTEYLNGDNAWFNEKTEKKEDIKKRITFWNFPKILVISLKRFSPDGRHKLNSMIDFPLENLDLSKYVSGYSASTYKYDLYGICNHSGGVMGGHYTSFVKHIDEKWIHFNDTNVEILENSQNVKTPLAYCLFYRMRSLSNK
jgi:ubiquitin carboxyl-terminal hydrolase 8